MVSSDIQVQFFQHLRSLLPPYKSLVDEVSDILDISNDSAYRRIRGEKFIDLDEIKKISQHFNISLDQIFNLQSNTIVFHGKLNTYESDRFELWLEDVLRQLELVYSHKHRHIYFLVKDMPPFYHFYHPELAAFKFFFWRKSILYDESLKGVRFDFESDYYLKHKVLCTKILQLYNQIPTTEIWNVEGINTSLRQIELYQEMGIIKSKIETVRLYECMLEVIDHLEKMAEKGCKFSLNQTPLANAPEYRLFVNEFIIGDNTFMAELDSLRITYLNHSVLYFIGSMDPKFNDAMFNNLENLTKKSTLISNIGEKERNQFFNKLRKKVTSRIQMIAI
ncbi:MAG TPA: helix-turn-helix domain-containing protein [Anditalea sp.]|nr:helix-turn-helix domain-containing protein [Anditalea sp.]